MLIPRFKFYNPSNFALCKKKKKKLVFLCQQFCVRDIFVHALLLGQFNSFNNVVQLLMCNSVSASFLVNWTVFFYLAHMCIYKHVTRQMSSMIHSARPTVSPVANIIFALFCWILKSGDGRTDGRDCGLAEWINMHGPSVSYSHYSFLYAVSCNMLQCESCCQVIISQDEKKSLFLALSMMYFVCFDN